MGETTPRAIRIPDDLWQAALEKAEANGDTVSDIVRRALERYVKR
jgi:predicted DNA-binding protein